MTSDSSSQDPLAALIVDGEELDKELIVNVLGGIAGLNKKGGVVQLAGFASLTARQKILVYLLAYKAAEILDLRSHHHAGSAELARSIGLAEGTVYPTVSQLRADRAVSQDADSKSFIAHHQVASAASEIGESTRTSTATQPKRSSRRRTAVSKKQAAKPAPEGDSPQKPNRLGKDHEAEAAPRAGRQSKPAGGFSVTSAVRDMIAGGFFNEPKGIGEVRTHLKDVHAREVPVTTLSPVFTRLLRSNALERRKNSSGTYEYVSAGSGS